MLKLFWSFNLIFILRVLKSVTLKSSFCFFFLPFFFLGLCCGEFECCHYSDKYYKMWCKCQIWTKMLICFRILKWKSHPNVVHATALHRGTSLRVDFQRLETPTFYILKNMCFWNGELVVCVYFPRELNSIVPFLLNWQ